MNTTDDNYNGPLEADAPYPLTLETMALRQKCNQVIWAMPEEGLEETLQTLKEYLDFYTQRIAFVPTPPAQRIKAIGRVMGTTQRPPLVIEDDD